MKNPFKYFKTSPEIIKLAVTMYVRFPLSLRQVEDLLHERGVDISYETIRYWWNWFGPLFAAEVRKKRSAQITSHTQWRWHLDEVFCEDRWPEFLIMACRRSRRRSPGVFCHQEKRSEGSASVFAQNNEKVRKPKSYGHR